MKKNIIVLVALSLWIGSAFGQATNVITSAIRTEGTVDERLQIAASSVDYPVTPGDIYRLTYRQTSDVLVIRDLLVNSDSTIDLNFFGKIDASLMSFVALKLRVEEIVASSYPRSLPSLNLAAPGTFQVRIKGEIDRVRYVSAWGLSRLSEVCSFVDSPHVSMRSVDVQRRDGTIQSFDLLKAMRLGVTGQDTYVKPGDEITLKRAERTVKLEGEIRYPGNYTLTGSDTLKDLIEVFGGGLTALAETSRIRIDHYTPQGIKAEYLSLPGAYETGFRLAYNDVVTIQSNTARRAVVWLEGALDQVSPAAPDAATAIVPVAPTTAAPNPESQRYTRIMHSISNGERLSDVLNAYRRNLRPNADLSSAVIYREGIENPIPVDLLALLSSYKDASDMPLMANDTVFIPEYVFTVTVTGAVVSPGIVTYKADKPIAYFIALAGGVDPNRNATSGFRVTDALGNKQPKGAPINPGDIIYVPTNSFLANFERYFPLFASVVNLGIAVAGFYGYLAPTWP